MTDLERTPPAGEEIHLPSPTVIPVVMAVGITLVVIGTTLNLIFSAIGAIVVIVTVIRWIADTRRDVEQLPEEHLH
jgi:Flp pilus assembly protein TadB